MEIKITETDFYCSEDVKNYLSNKEYKQLIDIARKIRTRPLNRLIEKLKEKEDKYKFNGLPKDW